MFEADSQHFASAPSVPRGFKRKEFWPAFGGDHRGSISAPGTRRASVPIFAPTSPNNLEYLLAMSKNLAHPLHPVYDDGKEGGWKWWE